MFGADDSVMHNGWLSIRKNERELRKSFVEWYFFIDRLGHIDVVQ
jgi:hypothetical protein